MAAVTTGPNGSGTSSPMERVKMLNMREDALLKRHLDTISSLEKKQLNTIAKDTINLRMELRAHRFRAMKTLVRQKGALQEFDEKWRRRKAALARQESSLAGNYEGETGSEGSTSGRRSAGSVYDRLYQTAGAGYMCPAPPPPFHRPQSSIFHNKPQSTSDSTSGQKTNQTSPGSAGGTKRLLDRRTPEPGRNIRSPSSSSEPTLKGRSPVVESNQRPSRPRTLSSSRSATSSSLSHTSTHSLKPHPPPAGSRRSSTALAPPITSTSAPAYRRPSVLQRAPGGGQKDYIETLLQSIAGGKDGTKVAGERGGNTSEALLSKLENMSFNEYTDGSMAMEMRRLKRKSVVHGIHHPLSKHSSRHSSTSGATAAPSKPERLHTAPPTLGISERKQAKMAAAVAAATTWRPPVLHKAWRGSKQHDTESGLAQENEGLMRLHREGQRQEYEEVLRRVNRFLGKPHRGSFIPRDNLSKEDAILLNKVRPPRTRLKGAVKMVMFLGKAGGLKALTEGLGNKANMAAVPEVK